MQQKSETPDNRATELAVAMQAGCLGTRIGRLQRLVARRFDQELRPLGLSVPQLEVLSALLVCAAPVKPSDLAGLLAIERSTMSRNLALLENHGLARTSETSPTGRSLRVEITAAGTAALAEAEAAWSVAQQAVRVALGDEATSILDTWLANLGARDTAG